MKGYWAKEGLMASVTHVAASLLRPKVMKGFDVLVPVSAERRNSSPQLRFRFVALTPNQLMTLEKFDDRRIAIF